MFQLTREEFDSLTSQIAMSEMEGTANSSQIAMSSRKHRGMAYRPWVFTQHGALQAANVIRSSRAVQMSVFVVRAFLKMRTLLEGFGNPGIIIFHDKLRDLRSFTRGKSFDLLDNLLRFRSSGLA
jgi:hypothetical protein